jgi:hypothetical protein
MEMSWTLKNANGKTVCHIVAKTSRGFNAEQKRKIAIARACILADPFWSGFNRPTDWKR